MLNAVRPSDNVWKGVAPYVRSADLAIANLEIPLTDWRTPTARKSAEEIRRRDQFVLKASPSHASFLVRAGWDLVGLANNHALDYGPKGLEQMQLVLRKHGLGYAGAGASAGIAAKPAVFRSKEGFRVALIAAMAFVTWPALYKVTPATETEPGVHGLYLEGVINDEARTKLRDWIAEARKVSDFVIVGFHWGTERKSLPNAYQVQLGRAAIDAGADIVWGHHPHVLQGAEIYRGKPIFYSLGNLISPTPADTALMRLTYDARKLQTLEIAPAWISGGRVALHTTGKRAALDRFRILCSELVRRFPHKDSVAAY